MAPKVIINRKRISEKVAESRRVRDKSRAFINANLVRPIEDSNKKILSEFSNHVVTREIKDGAGAENISGTLDGDGNLYTFIGFDDKNPIDSITKLITNQITVKVRKAPNKLFFYIKISIPSKEDIFAQTPMPWASGDKSWAEGIEKGISGLGYYLYSKEGFKGSRSGKAIQVVPDDGSTLQKSIKQYKKTGYIKELLIQMESHVRREVRNSFQ